MRRLILTLLFAAPGASAAGLPVLSGYPGCNYERLGNVQAVDGRRPDGSLDDGRLRQARYSRVFERLAAQGEARGANAIVVNLHEADFYTKNGRRTTRPVYVAVSGAAIRVADAARCRLDVLDADALQARALQGKAADVVIKKPPPPPVF
ncbi:MAG TPA: hypothetical protein VIG88_04955 [Lysobacter sp.]